MSSNLNYNRHNSLGGSWHVPGIQGMNASEQSPEYVENVYQMDQQRLQQQQSQQSQLLLLLLLLLLSQQQQQQQPQSQSQLAGFRNPWYTQALNTTMPMGSPNLNQSPTKSLPSIPLLQQQQLNKRLSFNKQLPTTYEYGDQQAGAPQFIHPPARADNPFRQYYTQQEVSLASGDRRVSALADGSYHNAYNSESYNAQVSGGVAFKGQYQHSMASGIAAVDRRASVASTNYHAIPTTSHAAYNTPFARVGRSPLIIQYQQYQQALQNQASTKRRKCAPRAIKIYNKLDLKPKFHQKPKYRRCSVNSIHISPLNALSVYLTESYGICQPKKFQYRKSTNPKRVLTKPLDPMYNNGFDNEDSDYILYVNDILGTEEGRKYIVLDLLGSGTFGQVVKCQNLNNQSLCAIKVIKSKPAYMNQSLTEVKLLEYLNTNSDGKHFIRLLDTFMHKEHLCLVFELLASNLYELIKQNQFQGLNLKLVKILTKQLLESMAELKGFQMIHCDLKPENILLCQPDKPLIKVIDFGSACFTRLTLYSYIQSRFYRSPEIVLGLPYTECIDMWSLGCIVGELFLGIPMFPGTSEYNQIWKIVDMLGNPPRHMIEVGKNSLNFFNKVPPVAEGGRLSYVIKSFDEYVASVKAKDNHKKELPNKNYFKHRLLKDIILNYRLNSKKMTNSMIEKECQERLLLVDFLAKALNLNPLERLTPQEGLKHPFVADVGDVSSSPSH